MPLLVSSSPAPCHLVSSSYHCIVHDHRGRDRAPRETSLENVYVHDVDVGDEDINSLFVFFFENFWKNFKRNGSEFEERIYY